MENYEKEILQIVKKHGGYREKEIIRKSHEILRSTWNSEHKVIIILEMEEQEDGYRNGIAIDLVTKSICG